VGPHKCGDQSSGLSTWPLYCSHLRLRDFGDWVAGPGRVGHQRRERICASIGKGHLCLSTRVRLLCEKLVASSGSKGAEHLQVDYRS
jgi:hypothetical protein